MVLIYVHYIYYKYIYILIYRERVTEDEMAGWHHQCNGNELGQIPGDGEGQGSLGHCKVGHN